MIEAKWLSTLFGRIRGEPLLILGMRSKLLYFMLVILQCAFG